MQNNADFSENANLFPLQIYEGVHVVDSRLIAEALGIEHRALIQLVYKHQIKIEQGFGQLTFQMEVVKGHQGGGNPKKYALLNEEQAIFIATLSRNTEQVVNFKVALVASFSHARKQIEEARQLLDKVQDNMSSSIEIKSLRQDVNVLQRSVALINHNLDIFMDNFKKASEYFDEMTKEITALKIQNQKSIGDIDSTTSRVSKIEDYLDFQAIAAVYILYNPYTQYHKIGSSHDTKGRKKDFNVVEERLEIVYEIPSISRDEAYTLENALKKRFKNRHTRGEWYELKAEDLEYLYELQQNNRKHLSIMS